MRKLLLLFSVTLITLNTLGQWNDTDNVLTIDYWNNVGAANASYGYYGMCLRYKNNQWESFHSTLNGMAMKFVPNGIDFITAPVNTIPANISTLMRIQSDGKLGIGTPNPEGVLHVYSTNEDAWVYFTNNLNGNNNPKTSQGLAFGWNYSAGQGESIINYNTVLGSQPRLDFTSFDGSSFRTEMTLRDGFLGIGKTSPYAKLDVATGNIFFDIGNENRVVISDDATDTNADSPKLCFYGRDYAGAHITGPSIQKINTASYGRGRLAFFQHGGADYTSEAEVMSILYNGNVGIGTTSPTYLLSVKGTIGCGEVIVENVTGWADFVFEDDYHLMPLQELDSYIQENKHLPEIPTSEEVQENGISVGEMNAKLLQKIEELTLHTIEQQKIIEKQQDDYIELKNEIEELKKLIK